MAETQEILETEAATEEAKQSAPEPPPIPQFVVISGQSAVTLVNMCRQTVAPAAHMKIQIAQAQMELEAALSGQQVVKQRPMNRAERRANEHNHK